MEKYIKGLFKDNGTKRFEQEKLIESKDWQEKRLILDFDTYACDGVITKMSIAAKKNSIEVRSPFLTKELIEYAFKVPHLYKYYNKNKKYILKQILYDYIPKEYFSDQKKGFGIPTKDWLSRYFYDDLLRVSSKEFIEQQNIFNYDVLKGLIKNIDQYIYYLRFYGIFICFNYGMNDICQ